MNRPGLGFAAAARSSEVSRAAIKFAASAFSGRGLPAGGIAPERSLRITFSQISGFAEGLDMSALSSSRPAVLIVWLWQVTQYWFNKARGSAAAARTEPAASPKTRRTICLAPMKEHLKAYSIGWLVVTNPRVVNHLQNSMRMALTSNSGCAGSGIDEQRQEKWMWKEFIDGDRDVGSLKPTRKR
jgi:hypothetical protein